MSIRYTIAEPFGALEPLVESIACAGAPVMAKVIYSGRNTVYTLPMPSECEAPFSTLNIKAYRVPHIINRIVYGTFRHSKAHKAFCNALRLIKLGIRTPMPVAFIEETDGALFGHSFFMSEQLGGDWQLLRYADRRPDFEDLAAALGKYMAVLHDKKVWMKDFSSGNVLVRTTPPGRYEFALIDINRMEFDIEDRSKLMQNFEGILDTPAAVETLARHYALACGAKDGSDEMNRTVRKALDIFREKLRKAAKKKKMKKMFHKEQP